MSAEHQPDRNRDQTAAKHAVLFIDQNPESFQRENVRAIASHARKWQTARKHQKRRDEAQREANYARGLVGWKTSAGQGPRKQPLPVLNLDVVTPKDFEHKQKE